MPRAHRSAPSHLNCSREGPIEQRFIGHEVKEAIAPTIFFLLFHLLAFTKALILEIYSITVGTASIATVMALIVAKAILIANKLPWAGRFSGRPLLIAVLWKTAIYALLCLAFRLVEEPVPLVMKYGSVTVASRQLLAEVSWPHFWALHLWLLVALATYAAAVGLDRHLGAGSVRRVFLGWPGRSAPRP